VCGGTILTFVLLSISKAYENVKLISSVSSLILFIVKIIYRAYHRLKKVKNPRNCG
jgi:hypothetical protein